MATLLSRTILLCILILFCSPAAQSQATAENTDSVPELPFLLNHSKRLSEEDIKNKKEGFFATGYPRFQYDPIRKMSAGGLLNLFKNNTREDPFFYYTPYRFLISAKTFVFQNGRVGAFVNFDAPYIFNTKWRLRVNVSYRRNPNERYYGLGRSTLNNLRFSDKSRGGYGSESEYIDNSNYEENLSRAVWDNERSQYLTDAKYHSFFQREQRLNVMLERVYFEGRLRYIIGYEALFTSFEDYTGRAVEAHLGNDNQVEAVQRETKIRRDQNSELWDRYNLAGFSNDYQFSSLISGAVAWDTRDLEVDPGKGILIEYAHEYSAPWLGSQFDFHKIMLQGQFFKTLVKWKDKTRRLVFAGTASTGYIFGSRINFIELFDITRMTQPTERIMVMGGEMSLRGYRESRFAAPCAAFINLELRSKLINFKIWNQDITAGVSPFYDMGNIWDSPAMMTLKNTRGNPGMGLRFTWNQSTILRIDYALSKEGSQFFIGSGHTF